MFFAIKPPIDVHLSKRLKEIRVECGVTQEELGELVGVTFQQIQKYESCVNKLSASRLYEICRVLDKPINSFFKNIQIEEGYYNFEFTDEEIVAKDDESKQKEIRNLIKSFSRIKEENIRAKIIQLVTTISTNYKPYFKRY